MEQRGQVTIVAMLNIFLDLSLIKVDKIVSSKVKMQSAVITFIVGFKLTII